jgi:two-component system, cell cycle response regulator DivK
MKRTILLVEDNAQNRYLTTYLLEHAGYTVIAVNDGSAALAEAKGKSFAAILLDIQLPRMDGYAVARALRESPSLRSVPIIAVTSYAMVGDREKALDAGCSGYIEKPIDPVNFVAQIEDFLTAARTG